MEEPTELASDDTVLRAMTDDGAFRVVTTDMTDTVTRALQLQDAAGPAARFLGELLIGAVLVRETMAPQHRVQGLVRTSERTSQLVADAHPDGGTRGLLTVRGEAEEFSPAGGTLEMMRTLYTGELHRGVVRIGATASISEALMTYMAESEQVASMIAVSCVMGEGHVRSAGGYIVQLLPEVDRGALAVMTERLRDFEDIDELLTEADAAPEVLLSEILYGMPYTRLSQSALSFRCRCDRVRVMSTLASLGREELSRLIEEGGVIELSCDYCNREYKINPNELKGLLDLS